MVQLANKYEKEFHQTHRICHTCGLHLQLNNKALMGLVAISVAVFALPSTGLLICVHLLLKLTGLAPHSIWFTTIILLCLGLVLVTMILWIGAACVLFLRFKPIEGCNGVYCWRCRYDNRANPAGPCVECGAELNYRVIESPDEPKAADEA